jgi:hypothetical protein
VPEGDFDRLFSALERAGCMFDRHESRAALHRISLFTARFGNVLVDLFLSFHPLHHESLRRRVSLRCPDGNERWFLSAEDLSVYKLALARLRDYADLERLFAARGPELDVAYIRRWLEAIAGERDARVDRLEDLIRRFAGTKPS